MTVPMATAIVISPGGEKNAIATNRLNDLFLMLDRILFFMICRLLGL